MISISLWKGVSLPHLGLETRQVCILWVQKKSRDLCVVYKRREKLRLSDACLLQMWDSGAHDHLGSVGAYHFFLGFVICFLHYIQHVFMIDIQVNQNLALRIL